MELKSVTMFVSFDFETNSLNVSIDGIVKDGQWEKRVTVALTEEERAQINDALNLIPAAIRRQEGIE